MKHATLALMAAAMPCAADVTVTIEEVGDDVYMSGNGTLDVSLWELSGMGALGGGFIWPHGGVLLGPGGDEDNSESYEFPVNLQGPDAIGEGMVDVYGDSGGGDDFGFVWGVQALFVPLGYEAGDHIEGDATFANQSLESIGLTEGSYTWTWDTADGAGDSFTIIVGPAGCDADVNGDGELSVLDFVAFQQLWQAGDPVADCDANADFNVLDFVCFQQLFQAGCN
jgi:hypothetical protein